MINLNFRVLVFISAARHLNFTRAAREMNISQPAVSKNIQELEVQAGRNLFERAGHRLLLTEAGKLLLNHAMQLTATYANLNFELSMLDGTVSGELRLGASTTLSHFILPEVLAAFHFSFPSVSIKVLHGNSRKIEDLLAEKSVDLGVVEGLSDNFSLKYEAFVKDEVVLVARTENPIVANKESIHISELPKLEYVFREQGSGTKDIIRKAFTEAGIDWQSLFVRVRLASTESIKNFLTKTDCFSFISIHAISKELQNGELRIVEVEDFVIERNFYFVRPHGVIGQLPETFRQFTYKRFTKNGVFYTDPE